MLDAPVVVSTETVVMKELVIDRTRWYRGQSDIKSRLLRSSDMKMCCLGFYSLACGLKEENIKNVAFPSSIRLRSMYPDSHKPVPIPIEMRWLEVGPGGVLDSDHRELETIIGQINDYSYLNEATREQKLTELFAANNVKVTFIN